MAELAIDFEKFQFEGKVATLLEAIGFDRSEEEAWRGSSVDGVLRTMKEWEIVKYEPGMKYTPRIIETNMALLIASPSISNAAVCLYGSREVMAGGAFIPRDDQEDLQEQNAPQLAVINHVRLYKGGLYRVGHIAAGRYNGGATYTSAFNDPRNFRLSPKKSELEKQIVGLMVEERLKVYGIL